MSAAMTTVDAHSSAAVSVQSLGSGSSGNGFLITSGSTTLLLDCGVGIRTIQRALKPRDLRVADLDAVLVTHEHTDHIRNLSCVTGTEVPIISTLGTARRGNIPPPQWERIEFHRPLVVGDITVWAIIVQHDAAEPCGFLLEMPGATVTIFTDLGSWHERLASPIAASDLVVLESNHDLEMLQRGPYPAHLKRRVAAATGHLSNADCGSSLATTLATAHRAPQIWLAHLSDTNNRPELAEQETRSALAQRDLDLPVLALPRTTPGPVWSPSKAGGLGGWRPALHTGESRQLTLESFLT
jgi:phosphoribosyl 1,2-cyclic phosphodiesterase